MAYAWHSITTILAGPPTGDAYAHTLSFQIISFLWFKFPVCVGVLIVFFVIEWIVFKIDDLGRIEARPTVEETFR